MVIEAAISAFLRDLARRGEVTLAVAGGCMQPTLRDGSRVRVRARRWYWPGDVVAFRRRDGRLLVHRVLGYGLGRDGWTLLARGDRLSREDRPVPLGSVIGGVVATVDRRGPLEVSWADRLRACRRYCRAIARGTLRRWSSPTAS